MKVLGFPKIEPKFKDRKVPAGFINNVRGWSFSKPEVEEAAKTGSLLTIDMDMAGKGVCSLRCGHCFRRTAQFHKEAKQDAVQLAAAIKEAKELGLRTVKIIGPGEPLEERTLLPFLNDLADGR